MLKTLLIWLINPGYKICQFFHVTNDHKTIMRAFINLTWYSHWGAWIALLYVINNPI